MRAMQPAQVEQSPVREEDRIVFKRSHFYTALLPAVFLAGLAVGYLLWGRGNSASAPRQTGQSQPAAQQQTVKRYDVPEDEDPSIGPANAAITIIEFSDYECPFCRKWFSEVYVRLLRDYPTQVRLVFRDFPLASIHPNATPAAEAANCAGDQGAYWEFHDMLFTGLEFGLDVYLQYASSLNLNVDEFKACVESRRHNYEVMGDYQFAAALGVRSTPTFFINGIPVVGAQPYEVFKELIEKELAGEIQ